MIFKKLKMLFFFVLFFLSICFLCFNPAAAQEQSMVPASSDQVDFIKLITPAENSQVIGKKPEIKIGFAGTIDPAALTVIIDGTDVTEIGSATEKGFEFTPVMVLPAGTHTISVFAFGKDNVQIQRQFVFTSRHSETFNEAYSNNEASVAYEAALMKPERVNTVPYSKIEGNLRSDSKIKEKEWEFRFTTNVRYFDMNLPLPTSAGSVSSGQYPLLKGFSLPNYLFSAKYSKDELQVLTEIGDVQISETQNTVLGLARRGGKISIQYGDFSLNTFLVNGGAVAGFRNIRDGIGIDTDLNDHIFGVSSGIKFFSKKAEFKTIYVTGGTPGSSAGISTASGPSDGNVLGLVLTTDFLENRLRTEVETDFSSFDPDTSDNFRRRSGEAYRVKAGGTLDIYTYEAKYEYFSRDFAVVGNPGSLRDSQIVTLFNSLNFTDQAVSLILLRSNDNVSGDSLLPKIVRHEGSINYSFSKIKDFQIGLSYLKSAQKSKKEPSGTDPLSIYTDSISGAVSYLQGGFNLSLMTLYSIQNDRTQANNDTTTITFTLAPSYNITGLTIAPSLSYNRSKVHQSGVWTDTYTANMQLRSKFFRDRISFDADGLYTFVKADDSSARNRNVSAYFRLGYNLKEYLKRLADPSIAIRGAYINSNDRINPAANRDDFTLLLVLSTAIPFSF